MEEDFSGYGLFITQLFNIIIYKSRKGTLSLLLVNNYIALVVRDLYNK